MKRIRPDRCRGASDSRLPSPIPARVYRTLDEEVKRRYHPIPPRYEHLPAFCLFLYAVAAVCLILLIIQSGSALSRIGSICTSVPPYGHFWRL